MCLSSGADARHGGQEPLPGVCARHAAGDVRPRQHQQGHQAGQADRHCGRQVGCHQPQLTGKKNTCLGQSSTSTHW